MARRRTATRGDTENSDAAFNIRKAEMEILRGSLVIKSKMKIRRLDKKIKDP